MPKLISSLRLKRNASSTENQLQMRCAKCGKRPATGKDGLCNQCRFDDVLTQLVENKES